MNNDDIQNPFDEKIAEIGQARALPTRLQILRLLAKGELCGCEIVPEFEFDESGVSRHLSALKRAGLIGPRRDGVRIYWKLADRRIAELLLLAEEIAQLR
ncbi:MAG: metalloregulator ArsR/SmtB family transcription factor [Candidatus Bipolaricaulota bacterium]|nr:metalloregulator ArsR/SmtB family transcription factor [Candidatus Bipolaricaulota bacterium]